jgi:hypothetical protein
VRGNANFFNSRLSTYAEPAFDIGDRRPRNTGAVGHELLAQPQILPALPQPGAQPDLLGTASPTASRGRRGRGVRVAHRKKPPVFVAGEHGRAGAVFALVA